MTRLKRFTIFTSGSKRNTTRDLLSDEERWAQEQEEKKKILQESLIQTEDINKDVQTLLNSNRRQWVNPTERNRLHQPIIVDHLNEEEQKHVDYCRSKYLLKLKNQTQTPIGNETITILSQNRTISERFFYMFFNPAILETPIDYKIGLKPFMKIRLLFTPTTTTTTANQQQQNKEDAVGGELNNEFHICLLVGCWCLEWDRSSSLVIVKQLDISRVYFAIDLERFTSEQTIYECFNTISQECCVWNGSKEFNVKTCNNQHFLVALLDKLKLSHNLKGLSKIYFDTLLESGSSGMTLKLSEELIELIKVDSVTFKTHEELDKFTNTIHESNPYYFSQYISDELLLKCFDEQFWSLRDGNPNQANAPLMENDQCQCYFNKNQTNFNEYVNKGKAVNNVFCSRSLIPPMPIRF